MLVLPIVAYGYTGHVMDFPGTINTDFEHFMHQVLDITKSAGLPRLQEDHPAQRPRLEHAEPRPGRPADQPGDRRRVRAGRAGGTCSTVDKDFLPRWRQSKFPGGCAHACELETSLYLYLDGDNVRKDLIKSGDHQLQRGGQPVQLGRPVRAPARRRSSRGRAATPRPACSATPSWRPPRRAGRPTRRRSSSSCGSSPGSRTARRTSRRDLHRRPPTMPIPWGQRPVGG